MVNSLFAFISVGSKHETHFFTVILNIIKTALTKIMTDQLTPKTETQQKNFYAFSGSHWKNICSESENKQLKRPAGHPELARSPHPILEGNPAADFPPVLPPCTSLYHMGFCNEITKKVKLHVKGSQ